MCTHTRVNINMFVSLKSEICETNRRAQTPTTTYITQLPQTAIMQTLDIKNYLNPPGRSNIGNSVDASNLL